MTGANDGQVPLAEIKIGGKSESLPGDLLHNDVCVRVDVDV